MSSRKVSSRKTRSPYSTFVSSEHDRRTFDNELAKEQTPQNSSPSYRLAFTDVDFLTTRELRPVRLQLELLKPEILLRDEGIESTVVVYGSARLHEKKVALQNLEKAEQKAAHAPNDPVVQREVTIAKRLVENSRYYDVAQEFGQLISEPKGHVGQRRYVVCTGGGPGIMEAANRGAHNAQAESIGLSIVLPHEQAPNRYVTPKLSLNFHYFAIRKMHFLIRAEALACFPGGFGTLDELFEGLTLIQTQKIQKIPVLLFGEAWWRRIINFEALVEEGTISPEDLDIFCFVDSAQEGWNAIEDFYKKNPRP